MPFLLNILIFSRFPKNNLASKPLSDYKFQRMKSLTGLVKTSKSNQPTATPKTREKKKKKKHQLCLKEIPVQDNKFVQVRPNLLNRIFLYFIYWIKRMKKADSTNDYKNFMPNT